MVAAPGEFPTALTFYATGNAVHEPLGTYSNFGLPQVKLGAPGGERPPNVEPPLPGCVMEVPSQRAFISACSSFSISPLCNTRNYLLGPSAGFAASLGAGVAAMLEGVAGGALTPGALAAILMQTAAEVERKLAGQPDCRRAAWLRDRLAEIAEQHANG
jgi:hypothetical protein